MNQHSTLIIAGEKSGEEHAMSFLPTLQQRFPKHHFWGVGGDEMKSQGFETFYHLNDFSSWGFSEVIGKIPFYLNALKEIISECEKRQTKQAILIDFQDFNLRLAKKLHSIGIKVHYYVAPQAWAWKAWRTRALERCVYALYTIIPFERQWFLDKGVSKVHQVAHPVWLAHHERSQKKEVRDLSSVDKIRVLLLPGSRNFEVELLLKEFSKAINKIQQNQKLEVGIVASSSVKEGLYRPYLKNMRHFSNENLSDALLWADCAFAASGTVTLTSALYRVPTIVCYKTSLLNEFIFYTFIKYKGYISLANIVHEKEVFKELIQNQVGEYEIVCEFFKIIKQKRESIDKDLIKTSDLISGDMNSLLSEYERGLA